MLMAVCSAEPGQLHIFAGGDPRVRETLRTGRYVEHWRSRESTYNTTALPKPCEKHRLALDADGFEQFS
jgi:hypothetical protein